MFLKIRMAMAAIVGVVLYAGIALLFIPILVILCLIPILVIVALL